MYARETVFLSNSVTLEVAVLSENNKIILSVSFLQQSAPEFILTLRTDEYKFTVDCRQSIIYHHIIPYSVSPEAEVEYTLIVLRFFRVPFLCIRLRYYLQMYTAFT